MVDTRHNTGRKINALLYFHRITDIRMTSTSVKSFDFFSKICGLSNMRNVMIVTNMWATPADPEEERRYEQLKTSLFKAALDNGAKMCQRRGIGPESAQAIIQMMVDLPPIELQLQTELAQGFALDETEAGRLVDQDLRATLERQRREREKLEEELRATREDRDRLVQESKQDLKQRVDSLKASRWPSHTTARKRSSTALSSPTLDFPGHGDQSGGRSGGSQKRTLKMFLAGSDQDSSSFDPATGNPPTYQKPSIEYRGEHVPVPLQKTDLSTWSSQSALAVGTSMDSSPSDSNPQYPYVVNGAAIFLDRGAAADIWLVETPESKYILKVLRLNLAYFSMSHTKKNSHGGTNRQDAPAQQFTQHFRSKAGAWSSLQHQNVIMVFGLGERLDLRVEFCENGTARKYLERHNNDIIRKKLMIQHILEGMNYLHSQSPPIVHGCLRADKVFVTADGTAKIGEFGLSFLTRGFALHAPSISQAGLSRWMSPELVDIDPDTGTIIQTTASDVWALACTLLEIISGEIPYTRYKHEIKVRKAIIKGEQPGTIGYDDRNNFRILSPILTECWDMSPNKRPPVSRVRLLADPPIASAPSSPKFSWTSWSNFGSPSKVDSGPRPPDDITPLPSLYPESKTDEPENTQAIRKTDRYQRLSGQASSPEGSAPMTVQSFDATHSTNTFVNQCIGPLLLGDYYYQDEGAADRGAEQSQS
ncbi:hypothetical protein FRC09_016827 [Ceratobasidium sp. 395]|nr:hypothetical protein FRC09_016827 [Ceratobasidium sp. 395]